MARKTNCTINGHDYFRLKIVVGHKLNANGYEVPVTKTFYGKSKKEAEDKANAYIDKHKAGIETKTQYFGILADKWITAFFMNDGSLKDSTKARYIAAWDRRVKKLDLYKMPLDQVTALTIQEAYNNMALSGIPISEIKTIHKLMRKFYRYINLQRLGLDVTAPLTIPKENINAADSDISVWTDDELKTIFNSFSGKEKHFRHRFLIVLAFYTGCRKSELLALKYEDITEDGVRVTKQIAEVSGGLCHDKLRMKTSLGVTDPKTKESIRTVPLDPIVLDELKRHKIWHLEEQMKNGYRTSFIFTTDSGEFYNAKNLDRALERFYKRIGIAPKTLHTYRHTYATILRRNGVPIEVVSKLLGHKDITTTAKYYVGTEKGQKRDAAMNLRKVIAG